MRYPQLSDSLAARLRYIPGVVHSSRPVVPRGPDQVGGFEGIHSPLWRMEMRPCHRNNAVPHFLDRRRWEGWIVAYTASMLSGTIAEQQLSILRWSWFVGQGGGRVKVYSGRPIMPPESRLARFRVSVEPAERRASGGARSASAATFLSHRPRPGWSHTRRSEAFGCCRTLSIGR